MEDEKNQMETLSNYIKETLSIKVLEKFPLCDTVQSLFVS